MSARAGLAFALLVAAAGGSWFLYRSSQEPASFATTFGEQAPGYYLEDAAILGTGEDGSRLYRVEARTIQHLPAEDRVAMQAVVVRYSDRDVSNWVASAREGSIEAGGSGILLSGEVRLRDSSADEEGLVIETEVLEFRPRERFASTNASVRITQPGVVLTARGMEADFLNERLRLTAEVSGRFTP